MAIMFVRAQVIGRGAGRSIVSAAAYRHRKKMVDKQIGIAFPGKGNAAELVHEELTLPDRAPAWLRIAIDGRTVAGASEILWNAVEAFEQGGNAQLARELIIALPEELTRAENIALVREFVRANLTEKGIVADWVYHDRQSNPHIHLMMTLRPLTEDGFGPKNVVVIGEDGQPLRVPRLGRSNGHIVYRNWCGDRETLKAWKIAWAETANRHLSIAGHDINLDGRSYAEKGLAGIAQKHLGPAKAALAKRGGEMYFAPAELARRQKMADRLRGDPQLLLEQLGNERSTFIERDIARALHRYVDDPSDFASIHAKLMMSDELVLLKPQQSDPETGMAAEPAIFTTRHMLRVEYQMVRSAEILSRRGGFAISEKRVAAAIRNLEAHDSEIVLRLDSEQIDAIRDITRDNGIAAVVGLAGTGKSTLLKAARIAWENDSRRVIGAALAGKAAEGLEDSSGIPSRTLASWEASWAAGRSKLERGDIFVIDEAGLVSSRQMLRVLKVVEDAGAKIVLVGDAMQLQPIQAGAAFRAIVERIGFAELSSVRRQREDWARDASRLLARGQVEPALDLLAAHGRITETNSRDEAVGRIVIDWTKARMQCLEEADDPTDRAARLRGDELLVIAHTNADAKRLNEALRAVMVEQGILREQRTIMTERGKREFAVGERIIFLENARLVEHTAQNLGPQHVKNGMLGTVMSITGRPGHTLLSVRLDSGREVVFGEDSYRNIDHGYAVTIHKSQGATVDRTFVLATGMMDRHLTYVAMTRHRDRVDLYAAKEDFVPRPEWERPARVDHAAGVSGELVAVGQAKFREGADVDPSPYAEVKTDDGKTHRLWGVSMPAALEKGGICVGDTVTLRKDGVERVTVKVPVVDGENGTRRYEERLVKRNVWTAQWVESGEARRMRIERESHRPELFKPLIERLSRSGAKTVTLDYQNEVGYQRHVDDFARRRGIDRLAEAAGEIEEALSKRWTWLAEKREKLAELWERASIALGLAIVRERRMAYDDDRVASPPIARNKVMEDPPNLLGPMTSFPRSVAEDARRAQEASTAWKGREVILRTLIETIYRDPDRALLALNEKVLGTEPRRLAESLARSPDQLGPLRGSEHLIDGRVARDERNAAMTVVADMPALARAHAEAFRKDAAKFELLEQNRRSSMSVSVPALSEKALARLSEIEVVRMKGGEDAYKSAFAVAAEDRAIVREIKAVGEALTARFGWSAFTSKADVIAERSMIERMPENLTPEKRDELARLFEAVKRFAEEQHQIERYDRSRALATASVPENKVAPPMLPAVTEFRTPVEEEARSRALARSYHRQQRAALAETATRIWRDPADAAQTIESLVLKGISAERITTAVHNDPTAYGALRGSGKMMDRLLAPGRERKEALQAVADMDISIKALASSYVAAFEMESQTITEERRRMAIAIPGLSQSAQDELVRLIKAARLRNQALDAAVATLDPQVRGEFAAVSKALDARFGRSAIARGGNDAANLVPATQRQAFEVMRESLKVLQHAVRIDNNQKIIAERNTRTISGTRAIGS
ncbi:Ti-type conjugative transfer relaxase TraA [Rhizobium jaguaris]|uniref:Ti-type conjugative transfer relaxase TraA n=1 Tax=Rhizobium jaguaris TaxID=1312183 RepID=UPI0039BFF73D